MGARLVQFKVEGFPKMRVIGKAINMVEGSVSLEDQSIENLWENMAKDGSLDVLVGLPGRIGPQGDLVGWMGDFFPPDMQRGRLASVSSSTITKITPSGWVWPTGAVWRYATGRGGFWRQIWVFPTV